MRREFIDRDIVHREVRIASLKERLPLIQSPAFARYREEKVQWLKFVEDKLLRQRTDDYTQGYLQGMVECLEDDTMNADQVSAKIKTLSDEVRDLRKTLSDRDDMNFRAPPPGGDYREAPPGVRSQGKSPGPMFPGGMI